MAKKSVQWSWLGDRFSGMGSELQIAQLVSIIVAGVVPAITAGRSFKNFLAADRIADACDELENAFRLADRLDGLGSRDWAEIRRRQALAIFERRLAARDIVQEHAAFIFVGAAGAVSYIFLLVGIVCKLYRLPYGGLVMFFLAGITTILFMSCAILVVRQQHLVEVRAYERLLERVRDVGYRLTPSLGMEPSALTRDRAEWLKLRAPKRSLWHGRDVA